jgi:hypothetical protein
MAIDAHRHVIREILAALDPLDGAIDMDGRSRSDVRVPPDEHREACARHDHHHGDDDPKDQEPRLHRALLPRPTRLAAVTRWRGAPP